MVAAWTAAGLNRLKMRWQAFTIPRPSRIACLCVTLNGDQALAAHSFALAMLTREDQHGYAIESVKEAMSLAQVAATLTANIRLTVTVADAAGMVSALLPNEPEFTGPALHRILPGAAPSDFVVDSAHTAQTVLISALRVLELQRLVDLLEAELPTPVSAVALHHTGAVRLAESLPTGTYRVADYQLVVTENGTRLQADSGLDDHLISTVVLDNLDVPTHLLSAIATGLAAAEGDYGAYQPVTTRSGATRDATQVRRTLAAGFGLSLLIIAGGLGTQRLLNGRVALATQAAREHRLLAAERTARAEATAQADRALYSLGATRESFAPHLISEIAAQAPATLQLEAVTVAPPASARQELYALEHRTAEIAVRGHAPKLNAYLTFRKQVERLAFVTTVVETDYTSTGDAGISFELSITFDAKALR